MNWKTVCVLAAFLSLLIPVFTASAGVNMTVMKTLDFNHRPLDAVTSPDGKYFFVLTAGGNIFAYDESGALQGRCQVNDNAADRLVMYPDGKNLLVISTAKHKWIQVLALDFFVEINTKNAPARGPEEAQVTVVVFSDFQCPYCARLDPLLNAAFEQYPESMRLVFKNYPLRSHKFAEKAAAAALAAERQGKFWEFHEQLFKHSRSLNDKKVTEIAQELGLNEAQFQKDLQDPEIVAKIKADYEEGKNLEVKGIPTVFINGRRVNSRELLDIQHLIGDELERVKAGKK